MNMLAAFLAGVSLFQHSGRFVATAYCLRGHTASGTETTEGTIAVDPSVILLGSRVWVSRFGYGRALDTGSAIRGRRVDLWIRSCAAAVVYGARAVVVRW